MMTSLGERRWSVAVIPPPPIPGHPTLPSIKIRKTKNPFVREPQYIAYSQATLNDHGWLDMNNLGLPDQRPGQYHLVASRPGKPPTECIIFSPMNYDDGSMLMPSWRVRTALEGGEGGVVTVVESEDDMDAVHRCRFMKEHENSERNRESQVGVFERVWAPIAQWIGEAALGPAVAAQVSDLEEPGGGSGAENDEVLEVLTEWPNVLFGSGLMQRQRGVTN